MKKLFENISKIQTSAEYEKVSAYVDKLIKEATNKGLLDKQNADNEYTREIGRVGRLCADYEDTKMTFQHLTVRGRSPLVRIVQQEMFKRDIKQKEIAKFLDINDSSFSLFMNGKRHLSISAAKKLHERLNIDPKLILEYA
jgi:antitoxin component HigA of HigAB toxin-antitoxin module